MTSKTLSELPMALGAGKDEALLIEAPMRQDRQTRQLPSIVGLKPQPRFFSFYPLSNPFSERIRTTDWATSDVIEKSSSRTLR